jgi:hypothetical protein
MKTKVGKSVKNEIDISVYKSVSDSSWNLVGELVTGSLFNSVSGPKHNSSVYSVWISVSDSIKK